MAETKKQDILEDVKDFDRRIRTRMVYKKLDDLKEWAKTIATLKEKTQVLLEELGVEKDDIKRLIDYVTNSDEAQLKESDKENIRREVKESIKSTKKKVEEKDLTPVWLNGTTTTCGSTTCGTSGYYATYTATGNDSIDFNVR